MSNPCETSNKTTTTLTDSDQNQKGGAVFPQAYITDMFRFFERHKDKIEVITYQDIFSDSEDYNYSLGYRNERKQWLNKVKVNQIDTSKAYVLLQYDIDSQPQRTMNLLKHPSHEKVPANIMRFAKRVDRRLLKTTNKLEYTGYELDTELMNRLSKNRFVIGYHSNCYERSHHDEDLAPNILEQDIHSLQKEHDIEFYTAHGGVPCANGKNNCDVIPLKSTSEKVRWVHNGATPFFNKQFSDGGHNSPLRDPNERDLRDFISNMKRGGRYRILIHPQYYSSSFSPSKRYSGARWYDEMINRVQSDPHYDIWKDVTLSGFGMLEKTTLTEIISGKSNAQLMKFAKSKVSYCIKAAKKTIKNL